MLVLPFILLSALSFAQQPSVDILVSVRQDGVFVSDLSPSDISVIDEKTPIDNNKVELRSAGGLPRRIALILDASVSTKGFEEELVNRASESIRPQDRLFLMKVAQDKHARWPYAPAGNIADVKNTISEDVSQKSGEDVLRGLEKFVSQTASEAAGIRRLAVVVDRGAIFLSPEMLQKIQRLAWRERIAVFVDGSGGRLGDLAAASGGASIGASSFKELLATVWRQCDAEYSLRFEPARADRKFHTLKIAGKQSNMTIRAPQGYFASAK